MTVEMISSLEQGQAFVPELSKMLQKCEELVERFEYDLALKFCEKILEQDPHQVEALQLKATIHIDVGQTEEAKQVGLR